MSKEDFRRDLNNAIDSITGAPSPALRDRVRSSLRESSEPRRYFWLAGVATAVMAAVVVGIFFVINSNRPGFISAGGPSPSPSASPLTSPSPSPSASPSPAQAFMCTATTVPVQSPAQPIAYVDAIRAAGHPGYDRIVIEFSNGLPEIIELRPQVGATFTQGGSGQPVTLQGKNGLLISMRLQNKSGADAHTQYSGPRDIKTGLPGLVEVRIVEDFEGHVQIALGINGPACYATTVMANPTRLVIDIQAS